jgi:predicted nucleic acid-binding protein
MRIVVDTNIVFSAILNSNSRISKIILQPKTNLNFYSTDQLIQEINDHKEKLRKFTTYSEKELNRAIQLITYRIRFINVSIIPKISYAKAESLVSEIDEDDIEFVALAEHIKGRLWTGDKELKLGLELKKWNRIISTEELIDIVKMKI